MSATINTQPQTSDVDYLMGTAPTNYSEITSVLVANDKWITCRYLKSPYFDPSTDLCQSLHILFVSFAYEANASDAYGLRNGIETLLEYIDTLNKRNPTALHITKYTDINTEVYLGYQDFLTREGHSPVNIIKLKTATAKVGDLGILPRLVLPFITIGRAKKTEPLFKDGFESLQTACSTHILTLYKKLEFRAEVHQAEPYLAQEVMEEIRPTPTRQRLLEWQKHVEVMNRDAHRDSYRSRFARSPDPEIRALAIDPNGIKKFKAIYRKERDNIQFDGLTDPFEKSVRNWPMDSARALKTFLVHKFPFNLTLDELMETYDQPRLIKLEDGCDDVIKILLHRMSTANPVKSKNRTYSIDDLMALYYPTMEDMAALITFMMFQSGWNKETVLAVDQGNYEHILTGAIEEAIRVVYSEKNKSQNIGQNFEKPKRIHLPSRTDDPLSFYCLIGLCQRLSEPLAQFPLDRVPAATYEERMNPLFSCIRLKSDWRKGGRYTSIAYMPTFLVGIRNFLKMYEVIDNGKRLTTAKELTRRLRPTWLLHKKKNSPLSLLSSTMGHADRDTTDIFYDDSGAARQERMKRLRSELEAIIELLRARQFKGLLAAHAQAQASGKLKVFHIPGHTKALWACADQDNPDWVGSEIIYSTGKKCFAIAECIFCSQVRIFEDSLPFLIERASHLQEYLEERDADIGFDSRFQRELDAIQYILEAWGDEDDTKAASRYRRRNTPMLPRDLKLLEIIFESEDFGV